MSERHEEFEVGERPEVQVEFPSGALRVVGGEPGRVGVRVEGPEAGSFDIFERRGTVRVRLAGTALSRWSDHDVVVSVPPETALGARVASADVAVPVDLRRLDVLSASGDVEAGRVGGHATVKTASGSVRLELASGEVRMSSAAGDIEVARAEGSVGLNTAGGDIHLGRVGGALSIRSASGDVAVDSYAGADLTCATVSGDVSVGLEPGRVLDLDLFSLAGSIDNEFAVDERSGDGGSGRATNLSGEVGRLRVRSTAGDIRVRRAVVV